MMRQLVRAPIKLAVGQLRFLGDRPPPHPACAPPARRTDRAGTLAMDSRRAVAFHSTQKPMPLGLAQQRQSRQPQIRIGRNPFQQVVRWPTQRSIVAASNRSAAYSTAPRSPLDVSTMCSDRSNFAVPLLGRHLPQRQTRQLEPLPRRVLQNQQHLEQRLPRQVARRAEAPPPAARTAAPGAHRPRATPPHPRQQGAERRIPAQLRAQRQRVDEEADQAPRSAAASGPRSASPPPCPAARSSGTAPPGTPPATP